MGWKIRVAAVQDICFPVRGKPANRDINQSKKSIAFKASAYLNPISWSTSFSFSKYNLYSNSPFACTAYHCHPTKYTPFQPQPKGPPFLNESVKNDHETPLGKRSKTFIGPFLPSHNLLPIIPLSQPLLLLPRPQHINHAPSSHVYPPIRDAAPSAIVVRVRKSIFLALCEFTTLACTIVQVGGNPRREMQVQLTVGGIEKNR